MENKSKALEYLNISRSTFYYESLLEEKDADLRVKIEKALDDNPSYGHRRIAIELKTNKKRVNRVMKKFGIRPRRGRKKPWKRGGKGEFEPSSNLLASLFPLYKNHLWITDFTYLKSIVIDSKILQSMSKKGSPWQNGYQESFFGNWKVDIGDVNRFETLGELTAELYRSIYYYNNLRIHTSLRMPPKRFSEKFALKTEIKYNTSQERLAV